MMSAQGVVIGGGVGGIGGRAECLGMLRVGKPADSGVLEHETAALRRRLGHGLQER